MSVDCLVMSADYLVMSADYQHRYSLEASHTPSDRSNEWRADNRRLARPKTILNIDESKLAYKLGVFLS